MASIGFHCYKVYLQIVSLLSAKFYTIITQMKQQNGLQIDHNEANKVSVAYERLYIA